MATPTLEFLAGLIPIPALVSGFVEEEYLAVFGIALPYTNPWRHSHYVVAMAHHIISMWFLKCRIRYRTKVAKFISKVTNNYLTLTQVSGVCVCVCQGLLAVLAEGERGGRHWELTQDLTEATLDVLARYTHSNLSSLPTRSAGASWAAYSPLPIGHLLLISSSLEDPATLGPLATIWLP